MHTRSLACIFRYSILRQEKYWHCHVNFHLMLEFAPNLFSDRHQVGGKKKAWERYLLYVPNILKTVAKVVGTYVEKLPKKRMIHDILSSHKSKNWLNRSQIFLASISKCLTDPDTTTRETIIILLEEPILVVEVRTIVSERKMYPSRLIVK